MGKRVSVNVSINKTVCVYIKSCIMYLCALIPTISLIIPHTVAKVKIALLQLLRLNAYNLQ